MLYDLQLQTENSYSLNCSILTVSPKNVLAFACSKLKQPEVSDNALRTIGTRIQCIDQSNIPFYGVYLCPLQRPWNVVLLFYNTRRISCLQWSQDSQTLMVIDTSNKARLFQCYSGCLNQMQEIKTYELKEEILMAMHFPQSSEGCINLDGADRASYPETTPTETDVQSLSSCFICTSVSGKFIVAFVKEEVVKSFQLTPIDGCPFDLSDIIVYGQPNRHAYIIFSNFPAGSPIHMYKVGLENSAFQLTARWEKLQSLMLRRPRRSVHFLSPMSHRRVLVFLRDRSDILAFQIWELRYYQRMCSDVLDAAARASGICLQLSRDRQITKRAFVMIHAFSDHDIQSALYNCGICLSTEVEAVDAGSMNGHCPPCLVNGDQVSSIRPLGVMFGQDGRILYLDRQTHSVVKSHQVKLNEGEWLIGACMSLSGCLTVCLTSEGRLIAEHTYARVDAALLSTLAVLEHLMVFEQAYWDLLLSISLDQLPTMQLRLEQRFLDQPISVQRACFGKFKYLNYFIKLRDQPSCVETLLPLWMTNVVEKCREYMNCVGYRRAITKQAPLCKVTDFAQDLNYSKIEVRLGEHLEGKTFVEIDENVKVPKGLLRMSQWSLDVSSFLAYVLCRRHCFEKLPVRTAFPDGQWTSLLREPRFLIAIREMIVYCRIMMRVDQPALQPDIFNFLEGVFDADITTLLYDIFTAYSRLTYKSELPQGLLDQINDFGMKLKDRYKMLLLPAMVGLSVWHDGSPRRFYPTLSIVERNARYGSRSLLNNDVDIPPEPRWTNHFDPINMIPLDLSQPCTVKMCVNCAILTLTFSSKPKQVQISDIIDGTHCECGGLFLISNE